MIKICPLSRSEVNTRYDCRNCQFKARIGCSFSKMRRTGLRTRVHRLAYRLPRFLEIRGKNARRPGMGYDQLPPGLENPQAQEESPETHFGERHFEPIKNDEPPPEVYEGQLEVSGLGDARDMDPRLEYNAGNSGDSGLEAGFDPRNQAMDIIDQNTEATVEAVHEIPKASSSPYDLHSGPLDSGIASGPNMIGQNVVQETGQQIDQEINSLAELMNPMGVLNDHRRTHPANRMYGLRDPYTIQLDDLGYLGLGARTGSGAGAGHPGQTGYTGPGGYIPDAPDI